MISSKIYYVLMNFEKYCNEKRFHRIGQKSRVIQEGKKVSGIFTKYMNRSQNTHTHNRLQTHSRTRE